MNINAMKWLHNMLSHLNNICGNLVFTLDYIQTYVYSLPTKTWAHLIIWSEKQRYIVKLNDLFPDNVNKSFQPHANTAHIIKTDFKHFLRFARKSPLLCILFFIHRWRQCSIPYLQCVISLLNFLRFYIFWGFRIIRCLD